MKRSLSVGFTVLYWIALPFSALAVLGLGWGLIAPGAVFERGAKTGVVASFVLSAAIAALIVWRLRTHQRARKLATERALAAAETATSIEDR